ncbi:MAG: dUTP diphosphatase [Gaiellales bacterium]
MTRIAFQRLHPDAQVPQRAHAGDAGFDLHAVEDVDLGPGDRAAVGCGFAMALPAGMAALVVPRSGLALREGLGVLNGPGLIDAGYRGEVKVILVNHDPSEMRSVRTGDRIAQLVLVDLPDVAFAETDALPDSDRGAGGFGSTGRGS